ncbi:AAA family ATPase [Frankia sp. CiP3]|uniref:AAA family ATPase n=1 Tax=Frankia sp. CiP3 TaxID=2880971 RepID=UPI001EF6D49E|nr:AAA family ATPase [Frankia sp. CiP3]
MGARNHVYLEENGWDDFGFKTYWNVHLVDSEGLAHPLGNIRIGAFDLGDERKVTIPPSFLQLPENYFSLGADETYYADLSDLGDDIRDAALRGLRDVALDLDLFGRVLHEPVTQRSLLRSTTASTVRGQLHRMATGGARLSPYEFSFRHPFRDSKGRTQSTVLLTFKVAPESKPASNVHVIIGRNGVGKSMLLNDMANTLVRSGSTASGDIDFVEPEDETYTSRFSRLVSVSFSAFDEFEPLRRGASESDSLAYDYIGLKLVDPSRAGALKSPRALANEFGTSVRACLDRLRLTRWRRALEMLQGDPIFSEMEIASLAAMEREADIRDAARDLFRKLSSGHKIVLLTITRLVETVEEATLVLLDEPEAHLHPPLLAAFVRALSDLLENRNGVAIIATHSPVVLQEVPKSCVWKLRRSGWEVSVERPEIETFGENVGILTQEVFGLEVTSSGFHRTLADAAGSGLPYEQLVEQFGNQLGGEARALLHALVLSRRGRR